MSSVKWLRHPHTRAQRSFAMGGCTRALLAAALLWPSVIRAQGTCTIQGNGNGKNCNIPGTVAMQVNPVVELTLNSTSLTMFNAVLGGDYDAGFKDGGTLTLTAATNTSASVTAVPTNSTFTAPSGVSKPSTDLLLADNGGTYTALPATGLTLHSLDITNGSAATVKTVGFRMALHWDTDPPGNYSLGVKFTVTAP